jgi:fimbrial chaperone protein
MKTQSLATLAGFILLSGGYSAVKAGSYQVKPVRIELSTKQFRTTIEVNNLGVLPATIQTRLVTWTANGAEEVQADSDEILVNPPIFTVRPGQIQSVRVGLRRARVDAVETTYRLILEEIPLPPPPGFQGVTTVLKLSVPIFVRPRVASPSMIWKARRISPDQLKVSAENSGNAHVQVKRISINGADRPEPDIVSDKNAYVLRGGRKEWTLPNTRFAAGEHLQIEVLTDNGVSRETVVLEAQ